MEPWWNPAVERKAQDRIHRIGQYKPIRLHFHSTLYCMVGKKNNLCINF